MKHVLAIGDVADQPPARTVVPTPAQTLVKRSAGPSDVRKATGPAVWVQQSDGTWAVRWRGNDTWWDLSARYLQAGKRWRELFTYQSDAFHARVPEPVAIFTTALVAMPPEAVQRAQLLGEIPGGGGSAQPPGSGSAPGQGSGTAPGSGSAAGPGSLAPPSGPRGPIVIPSGAGGGGEEGHLHWWLLGLLGFAGATTIGVVAYRAHRAREEER